MPPIANPNARAYGAQAQRQQARRRLVYSEGDIRRNITRAATTGNVCDLEQAADIELTAPITIPGTLRSFSLVSQSRFALVQAAALSSIFVIDQEVSLVGIGQVPRSSFTGLRIRENGKGSAAIFTSSNLSADRSIVVKDMTIETEAGSAWSLFANDLNIWKSYFEQVVAEGLGTLELVGAAKLHDSLVTLCADNGSGYVSCVPTSPNCARNVFLQLAITGDIDSTAAGGNVFICAQSIGASNVFSASDVVLTTTDSLADALSSLPGWTGLGNVSPVCRLDVNGALRLRPTTVALTADNQVVTVGDRSYIRLSSDNATAANRTFVLAQGAGAGHGLTLEWTGTNAGELVDDSAVSGGGNHRLSATWTPTQYDTLQLIWNGTDWIETSRSVN